MIDDVIAIECAKRDAGLTEARMWQSRDVPMRVAEAGDRPAAVAARTGLGCWLRRIFGDAKAPPVSN